MHAQLDLRSNGRLAQYSRSFLCSLPAIVSLSITLILSSMNVRSMCLLGDYLNSFNIYLENSSSVKTLNYSSGREKTQRKELLLHRIFLFPWYECTNHAWFHGANLPPLTAQLGRGASVYHVTRLRVLVYGLFTFLFSISLWECTIIPWCFIGYVTHR